jgi:hypothetical protein
VVLTTAYTASAWAIQKLAIKGMANNNIRTQKLTTAFTPGPAGYGMCRAATGS